MAEAAAKFCPQCGKEILGGFESCVYCGWEPPAELGGDDRLEAYWYPAIWGMAFLVFPFGALLGWRMQAVWQLKSPRKAAAMARLNWTAHLVMLAVVIVLAIFFQHLIKPYVDKLLPSDFT